MRRWILILLLIASGGTVALARSFELLWQMNFGAARIGLVHQDGVTQWSDSGPKAWWPQWALKPDDGRLQVQVHYRRAPHHDESGFGYVRFDIPPAAAQTAYADKLRAAGWQVELSYFETRLPMSVNPSRACLVQALKDGNRLMLRTSDGGFGEDALFWDHGTELKPMVNARSGPC